MKNSTLWVVIVVLLVLFGGWWIWAKGKPAMVSPESTTPTTVTPTSLKSPTPTVPPKTIEMKQTDASGQSGTAVFEPQGDSTKVTLTMVGKAYTTPQPAHIHTGKCPTPGDVKYPLNNVVNGKSETVIAVKFEDLFTTLLPLAVNVHKSVEQASIYTACGDLY